MVSLSAFDECDGGSVPSSAVFGKVSEDSILLYMFDRIHLWSHPVLGFSHDPLYFSCCVTSPFYF